MWVKKEGFWKEKGRKEVCGHRTDGLFFAEYGSWNGPHVDVVDFGVNPVFGSSMKMLAR